MNDPGEPEVAIFGAALQLPASQRAAYLDAACAEDHALRQRVESFLADHFEAGAFLEAPAPGVPRLTAAGVLGDPEKTRCAAIPSEKVGDRLGRYKLLQQIGEGGCGVVYMAEQEEPVRRKLALKIIKLGMDTKSVIARFEAERQALAMMDHPNIAKVLDAGATDTGRPYFVMELVRGIKITDYCDQNQLPTADRLNLFIQVCQAIQHAHQKGVIHRDIKPSNILVTVNDGAPVPKVIDFGIAKATQGRLTDRTLFTAFEQFLGTPAYMSPEQALMTSLDIDTRSDIYSLGVLLYELLTGQTPFDGQELMQTGLEEMRRTIVEQDPARPSTRLSRMVEADLTTVAKRRQTAAPKLIHTLRGDLDWIVMKALEKDRARRYETSNGLGRDVQRFLSDEPVIARPPGNLYLLQKLVRRNKVAFAAATVITASLLLGLGVVTVAMVRIQQAKDEATEKLRNSYLAEARALRTSGRAGQRFASLEAVRKAVAIRSDLEARNEAIASLAASDLRVAKQFRYTGKALNGSVRFDRELNRYAVGEDNGSISLHAASNNATVAVLPAPGFTVVGIAAFSPNSRFLSARYRQENGEESDWIWDLADQRVVVHCLQRKAGQEELNFDLAAGFSSDSRIFASRLANGTISICDLASGKELKRLAGARRFNRLVFSPGNTRLACSSEEDPRVEIREIESGRVSQTLTCPAGVSALAWSPDGQRLVAGCMDFKLYVWDARSGQTLAVLEGHDQYIMNVVFNHAGNLLASASFEGLTRLWDPFSGRPIASFPGDSWQYQFSPDDRYLEGWGKESQHGILEVAYGKECRLLHAQRDGGDLSGPDFSADGNILCAGTLNQVRFWDAFSGTEIGSFRLKFCDTHLFHANGQSLIVIDRTGGVCVRSLSRTGTPAAFDFKLGEPHSLFAAPELHEADLSRDGRHLAVTQEGEGQSLILDLHEPSAKPVVLRPHLLVDRIAISPDGRWVATASWHNSLVKIWDAQSGDLVRTLSLPSRATVAFSPDGRWLATSTTEYQLWAVGSWQPKSPPTPGSEIAYWNFTAFSPDSRVIARTLNGRSIELLDAATEKPLASLEAPYSSAVAKFKFSPDGSQLAAIQRDQQVQLWDLRLIRQELNQMHLDWDQPPYPPANQMAATGPATLAVESAPAKPAPAP